MGFDAHSLLTELLLDHLFIIGLVLISLQVIEETQEPGNFSRNLSAPRRLTVGQDHMDLDECLSDWLYYTNCKCFIHLARKFLIHRIAEMNG